MKLHVGDRVVEVESLSDGLVRAFVDGVAVEAAVRTAGDAVLLVTPERTLELLASKGALWTSDGELSVEVLEDRQFAARAARGRGTREESVLRSPMPGRIVKVLCAVGDAVERGQGLVVVEAMKMENELGAPGAGTVKTVHVEPGKTVEGGQVLVELAL